MFWRDVVRKGHEGDIGAMDCSETMFWQDAGTLPDDPNAPTPEILADYAYDKIRVPDTKIEVEPTLRSTVNLPTWIWLDRATFKEVKVRAELPNTPLWAMTTAKPVALHPDPGTQNEETFPASGDCQIGHDGSIGTPYAKAIPTEPRHAASAIWEPPRDSRTSSARLSHGRSPGKGPAGQRESFRMAISRLLKI